MRSRSAVAVGVGSFCLTLALYVGCAAPLPFYNKSEPREALVVRAVLSGESLALPRLDGQGIPSKPPLFHWLAALAVVAGVRPVELAMRLPSMVMAATSVAAAAALATRGYGAAAGVATAAICAGSIEWLHAALQARVDMTLTTLVTLAVLVWGGVLGAGLGRRAVRLGYGLVALAVLAKGPVGAALPALVLIGAALATVRARRLTAFLDWGGIAGAAAIAGSWYLAAWASGGEAFVSRQILHENLERLFGGGAGTAHPQPVHYYGVALLGSFLPWTPLLPVALWDAWRARGPRERFLLAWAGTVFVFFSLAAGKRSAYLLPLFPPLAVLCGRSAVRLFGTAPGPGMRLCVYAAFAAAGGVALVLAAGWERQAAGLVLPFLEGRDAVRAGAVLAAVDALRPAMSVVALAVAACLVTLARASSAGGRGVAAAAVALLAAAWTIGLWGLVTRPLAEAVTPRHFAERVRVIVREGDTVWARGYVDHGFRFYLDRPLLLWPERKGPTGGREFTVGVVPESDRALARRGLVTRIVDLRRYGEDPLELCEVRGVEPTQRRANRRMGSGTPAR
jgi:4-amino-4-deoxy-L-arabinose transferase-like glycosyltransferase